MNGKQVPQGLLLATGLPNACGAQLPPVCLHPTPTLDLCVAVKGQLHHQVLLAAELAGHGAVQLVVSKAEPLELCKGRAGWRGDWSWAASEP